MNEILAFYTQGAFCEELFSSWSGVFVAAVLLISYVVPLIVGLVFAIFIPRSFVGYVSMRYGALSYLIRVGGWVIANALSIVILGVCMYYYITNFSNMSHFGAVVWAILVMIAPSVVTWLFKVLMRFFWR